MAEDKYIKLHDGSEISDIKFNNYYCPLANTNILCKTIVAKDNNKVWNSVFGEWQINDGWDVVFLSDKKMAIKKFRIDTWGLRKIFNMGGTNDTDIASITDFLKLNVKVSGLEYVHNNVVYQEDAEGNKIYGFTKAFAGTGGYNVYWYPGQFTSGNYIQGLGIQGGVGYKANENERDDGLQMGRHPWDIGSKVCINDGIISGTGFDGSYNAITIGLYGGYQTATKWHDYDNSAYKIYDISEHPIIIDLDVEDVSVPVDPSSIECWDMYLGEQQIFKKNRTVENCWLKYGFAEKVTGGDYSSANIYRLTNNCSSHINPPINGRKCFTPIVSDYKKYFTNKLISYSGELSDITNPIKDAEYYKLYNSDNMYHSHKCTSKMWVEGEKIVGEEYAKMLFQTAFYTKGWVDNVQTITQYISDGSGELVSSTVTSIPEGALEVRSSFECNNKYYNIETSWEEIGVNASEPKVGGFVWTCKNYNQKLWDDIRDFYANEYVINDNRLLDNIFNGSNMNGEVTLKLSLSQFSTAFFMLTDSDVKKLNIIVTDDNTSISSTQRMFRWASKLEEITYQNLAQPSKCLCAPHMAEDMFTGTQSLTTYPSNLIDWSNRMNLKDSPNGHTMFSYFIDGNSKMTTVPMCSLANGDREHNTNTIISTRIRQSLNGCTHLTYFGPTLDVIAVHPTHNDSVNCFNGCDNLSDIRIKNLNHGVWRFDGSSSGPENARIFHGNLKSLNQESIKYLFEHACDLTRITLAVETTPNVLNTFQVWDGAVQGKYSFCHYSRGGLSYRFLDKKMLFVDDSINLDDYLDAVSGWSTNKKFSVEITNGHFLDKLTVKITNLTSSDFIWFGTEDRTSGKRIAIGDLDDNGIISLEKNNEETYGFYLYTTDPTIVGPTLKTVTIEIVDPCNPYISSVHSASIYCPSEWSAHITSEMVNNMKNKGWTIYIGGVEKTVE